MTSLRVAATLLTVVTFVRAQSTDAGMAGQLFETGRDLMKNGDYATACPKLAESARLEPRVGTFGRLAECEEKLGHIASARGHWKDAVDLARSTKDDRLAHVEGELKRLDPTVPRLLLKATSTPAGFVVRVDDVSLGIGSLEVPLPVDPGHHVIVAAAADKKSWSGEAETKADGATTTITIPALEDTPKPSVASPPIATPHTEPLRAQRSGTLASIGLVTGIGGLVALAGVPVFSGIALAQRNAAFADGCETGGYCPSGRPANELDAARAWAGVSTVLLIGGAVLTAGGFALWLLGHRARPTRTATVRPTFSGLEGTW